MVTQHSACPNSWVKKRHFLPLHLFAILHRRWTFVFFKEVLKNSWPWKCWRILSLFCASETCKSATIWCKDLTCVLIASQKNDGECNLSKANLSFKLKPFLTAYLNVFLMKSSSKNVPQSTGGWEMIIYNWLRLKTELFKFKSRRSWWLFESLSIEKVLWSYF